MCVYVCPQRPEECLKCPRIELHMVITHHVGAGSQPGSSARAASALNCWAISSPWVLFCWWVRVINKFYIILDHVKYCDTFSITFSAQGFTLPGYFLIPHHFKLFSISEKSILKIVLRLHQIYMFIVPVIQPCPQYYYCLPETPRVFLHGNNMSSQWEISPQPKDQ